MSGRELPNIVDKTRDDIEAARTGIESVSVFVGIFIIIGLCGFDASLERG